MRAYASERSPERAATGNAPYDRHVNLWLRLTSSGWDKPQQTIQEREKARRSRLTAWIVLGLFVVDLVLVPTTFGDPTSAIGVVVAAITLLVVAVLNRVGLVTVAGTVLVVTIIAIVIGTMLGAAPDPVIHAPAGQLSLTLLPTFDLLAMAVLVAASILPRAAAFIVAGVNSVLIYLDFLLQPHAQDLQHYVLLRGVADEIVRPIALQIIIATVAYLWVRGTDEAIRRADRAEELAAMEHQMAEQKRQLDYGIRQILDVHVRVANGDYNARAPLTQDNVLFQIGASLNTLLNRLGRAAQSEYFLQRTTSEIMRLRDSLLAARAGRQPLWPAPNGTPVDALIEVLATPGGPRSSSQMASGVLADPFGGPGANGQPGQPPFGAHQNGAFDTQGQFGAMGQNSGPLSRRPPEAAFGPTGGLAGANSGPQPPGGGPDTGWQLPNMPPLPDWLLPNDDDR